MIVFSHYGAGLIPMRQMGTPLPTIEPSAAQTPIFSTRTTIRAVADVPRVVGSPGTTTPATGTTGLMGGTLLQITLALEAMGFRPRSGTYKDPDPNLTDTILDKIREGLGMPPIEADPLSKLKVIDLVMRKSQRIKDWIAAAWAEWEGDEPSWFPAPPANAGVATSGSATSALTGEGGTRAMYDPDLAPAPGIVDWVKENPGKAAGVGVGGVVLVGTLIYLLK